MLFLSRAAVAYAAIPTAINFVHFPLIFGAFVLSRGEHRNSAQRAGERILGISLVLAFAAVVGSAATPVLQTALVWAVLVEPIVVILTVWNLAARGLPPNRARKLALFVVLVQVPIALFQWVLFGTGDNVQGMLVNQGAGHHLLGMLGLVVALVGVSRSFTSDSDSRAWSVVILLLVAGLSLPVLTDTRQGIVVFIVVGVLLFAPAAALRRKAATKRAQRGVVVGFLLLTLVVAALAGSRAFSLARQEPWRAPTVVEAKTEAISVIITAMGEQPLAALVGLGGGATATRVAWLSSELGVNSYLSGFDLPPSPIASDLAEQWVSNPRWAASSVSSPFSTWGGVFGDLGLLGLAAYAAMWWLPWRASAGRVDQLETRAVVLFLALLGLLFNWLEEPQLTVVAALVVAAGTAPAPTPLTAASAGLRWRQSTVKPHAADEKNP
jgi:hypothetical protein